MSSDWWLLLASIPIGAIVGYLNVLMLSAGTGIAEVEYDLVHCESRNADDTMEIEVVYAEFEEAL